MALSWWKRGHELAEHGPAAVEYASAVPLRVSATIVLRALAWVSSVPNEPTSGLATIQSEVSFGKPAAGWPEAV